MNGPCVAFDGETVSVHLDVHSGEEIGVGNVVQPGELEIVPAVPSDVETVKETKKEAPDGGYLAWLSIVACMFLIALTSGLGKSFGGVKAAYIKELPFKNEIADIFMPSMFSVMTLLWAPVASALIRNLGARTMLALGCGLCVVGFLVSMTLYSAEIMLVSLGLCVGTGFSIIANYTVFVIGKLFKDWKPLALGLTLSGGCVGHEFMPTILDYLLLNVGVRGTFGVMAAGYFVVTIACLFTIGDPESRMVSVTTEVPVPTEVSAPVETTSLPGCSTDTTSLPGCSFWEAPEASACWERVPEDSSFWEGVPVHSSFWEEVSQAAEDTSFEEFSETFHRPAASRQRLSLPEDTAFTEVPLTVTSFSEIPAPVGSSVTLLEVKTASAFVSWFEMVSDELGLAVLGNWTFWLITLSAILFGLGNGTMIAALKFFSGVSVFNFSEFFCVLSVVIVRLTYGLLLPKSTFPRTVEYAVSLVGAGVSFMCIPLVSTDMVITSLAVGALFAGAWGALIPPVLGDCLGVSNIGKGFALLKFFRGVVGLCWIYPKTELLKRFGLKTIIWVDFGFVASGAIIAVLLCILVHFLKVRH